MKTKHTPGPWKATKDPDSIRGEDYCIGMETDVARIDRVAVCSECDASLIAAVPELLEAVDRDKMPEPVMWLHEQTGEILGNPWNPDDPLEQCKDPPVPLYSAETVQALLAEANEQARLNGMGAEHEARLMAEVERLRTERDALAKDAARYRWLRSEWTRLNCIPTKDGPGLELATTRWAEFPPDAVDSEIDAAMAEGER